MNFGYASMRSAVTLAVIAILQAGCSSPHQRNTQTDASRPNSSTFDTKNEQQPLRAHGHILSESRIAEQDSAAQSTPATEQQQPTAVTQFVEVFPSVQIDRQNRIVLLRGTVPIQVKSLDGKAAKPVYLEALVCSHDTKEHESLVVVDARPSHVHAALLMIGLEPGKVGEWREDSGTIVGSPANGPALDVRVRWKDGSGVVESSIMSWVMDQKSRRDLTTAEGGSLVFAGSRFARIPSRSSLGETFEAYMADIDGTLIGLTTFSSECIAWTKMHHHQSRVEEPRLIANEAVVPGYGTEVEIWITPAK